MRPVNKGSWPVDPKTNAPKVFKSDRKNDDEYKEAKADLIDRVGLYCSYCETWFLDRRYFHVEHKLPKSLHPSLRGDWDNFLLACAPCNDAKSDKDIELDDVYWPDLDNTAYIFEYREGGRVFVNPNLSNAEQEKAQRTLELTGLDRYPGGKNQPTPGDQRYLHRRKAWKKVKSCLEDLEKSINTLRNLKNYDSLCLPPYIQNELEQQRKDALAIPEKIVDIARGTGKEDKATGYWSIWMTVFREHPDMLKRFIEAFPGTARECFDEQGRPLPTISRSKSSTNVEPQPSYDSHIWDDRAESLLEEEEETSTELEAETPQPDSELLPVDDSFRSEEKSGSLFTRLIDAFSGTRQDYIGDRDELLSLEDSEPEPEDFLSEESAESESPDEPETETEVIDSETEPEDFLSEESAESESPDEPETETEVIDSEPESEDFLSEESAESESPDEPETDTEVIDSEPESEDSMETEAIDSEPEQPEATVNRQTQPTQPYSIPKKPPQSLETENDRKDKPVVNPSLTQTPRYQIADVIPLEYETSILEWLERSGRLIDRTSDNDENLLDSEEEIAELIENDGKYDDGDDDDILVDDD